MVVRNALRNMATALGGSLLVALALAIASPAHATAFLEGDDTDCLTRTTMGGFSQHDEVNTSVTGPQAGNLWGRLDTFALDMEACEYAFISGVTVIVKTPFQITPTPDIDDIDNAGDVSALGNALDALFPEFSHHTANAIVEAGAESPANFGFFHGVAGCIYFGGEGSVADCLAEGPTSLNDLDGMGMRFGLEAGEDSFYLDPYFCEECLSSGPAGTNGIIGLTEFQLVTIVYSNVFGEQVGNDIPEAVLGWQFVPEPTPLALLAPAFAGWAIRRRRTRCR